jgi:hypothetical protein
MQEYRVYFVYSLVLKFIAIGFGVCCALWGLLTVVLDKDIEKMPIWGWHLFGFYVVLVGLLYLVPNRRFSSDEQVRYYIGFILLNALALFLVLVYLTVSALFRSGDWASHFFMMFVLVPAALTAPASLVLHLKGARRQAFI